MRKWLLALAKNVKVSAPLVLLTLAAIYRFWSNWQRSQQAELESAKRRAEIKRENLEDEKLADALKEVIKNKERDADYYKGRSEAIKEELKVKEKEHAAILEGRHAIEKSIAEKSHSADELDSLAKSLGF